MGVVPRVVAEFDDSALGQISPATFEQRFADEDGERNPSNHRGIPTGGVCVAGATPPVDIPNRETMAIT